MCFNYLLPKPMLRVVVNDIPSIRRYADAKNTLGKLCSKLLLSSVAGLVYS